MKILTRSLNDEERDVATRPHIRFRITPSQSLKEILPSAFIPIKVYALQSQSHQSPDVIRDAQRQVDDDHYDGSFEFVDQDGHQSRLQTNDTRGLKFRCQLTQVHIYNSAQMLQT